MASTAHQTAEEFQEHFDPPDVLANKIKKLAKWVRASKHFIAFTGAGVSTSTGIPDFRSGMNTILTTGPGAWTVKAEVEKAASKEDVMELVKNKATNRVASTLKAIPSPTHMSLVELQRRGILQYLISQNTDGLHRRSGFPPSHLSELHGNSNLEICSNSECKQEYLRDFKCRDQKLKPKDHQTGRKCTRCGSGLKDTIINFGESLPEKALSDAFDHSSKADLCLAMGSSLRVTPAADCPAMAGKAGKLVVVNLQSTPLDDEAALVIHATCDVVMEKLMRSLDFRIPQFRLQRYVKAGLMLTFADEEQKMTPILRAELAGTDVDGIPFSLFTGVDTVLNVKGAPPIAHSSKKEPFCHALGLTEAHQQLLNACVPPDPPLPVNAVFSQVGPEPPENHIHFTMHFAGHYQEPDLCISAPLSVLKSSPRDRIAVPLKLEYNPFDRTWKVSA